MNGFCYWYFTAFDYIKIFIKLNAFYLIKQDLDLKIADLESKIIVLESKISEKEQKLQFKDMEIAKCLKDFNAAQEENKLLKNQLEVAQKVF